MISEYQACVPQGLACRPIKIIASHNSNVLLSLTKFIHIYLLDMNFLVVAKYA